MLTPSLRVCRDDAARGMQSTKCQPAGQQERQMPAMMVVHTIHAQ